MNEIEIISAQLHWHWPKKFFKKESNRDSHDYGKSHSHHTFPIASSCHYQLKSSKTITKSKYKQMHWLQLNNNYPYIYHPKYMWPSKQSLIKNLEGYRLIMSLPNVWHLRRVADTGAKACSICCKPVVNVLITPDNKVSCNWIRKKKKNEIKVN